MIESIPCPFCGGNAKTYTVWKQGRERWKVMCGARVDCCAILNDFSSEEEAIKVWNHRSV